jgi:hypothetical protein
MRLYDPIGGEHMNIMKAGLINSHRIVAVSGEAPGGVCVVVRGGPRGLRGLVVRGGPRGLRGRGPAQQSALLHCPGSCLAASCVHPRLRLPRLPLPPPTPEGYAWECQTQEGGWGLDAVVRENNWKLRGIVNGIDYS